MGSHFDIEKFKEDVDRVRYLIESYRGAKEELNNYTKKLVKARDCTTTPKFLLSSLEDLQFSKCIRALCSYKELVTTIQRLEENDLTKFTIRKLEKEIDQLEPIEAYFYFEYN